MRWLCRLVTPPGGTILDLFAGTGTTGEAALLENFSAILIEREAEYRADIARRMAHVFDGAASRKVAIAKAKGAMVQRAGVGSGAGTGFALRGIGRTASVWIDGGLCNLRPSRRAFPRTVDLERLG